MEQRITMVTLGVRDLARARAFYEALGWRGAQQPDNEVAFYQAGGMIFGLWAALGGHGAPGVELAHHVRSPEEVDALLADVERAGGTIVRPAAKAEKISGVMRVDLMKFLMANSGLLGFRNNRTTDRGTPSGEQTCG